jgi:hypothetical protein
MSSPTTSDAQNLGKIWVNNVRTSGGGEYCGQSAECAEMPTVGGAALPLFRYACDMQPTCKSLLFLSWHGAYNWPVLRWVSKAKTLMQRENYIAKAREYRRARGIPEE